MNVSLNAMRLGDPAGNMNRTFESAMTAIMNIENAINATRKQRKEECNRIFVRHDDHDAVGLLGFCSAVTKNNADTEYQQGKLSAGHTRL